METGVGQHHRSLPVHKYAAISKEEVCRALPFWFAITGCDTAFMFTGRGNKRSCAAWQKYPDVTQTFAK